MIAPRGAIAVLFIAGTITACLRSTVTAAAAFVIAFTFNLLCSVPASKILSRIALIAFSLLPFLIALPFSEGGSLLALTIALRAISIGLLALAVVHAVPFPALLAAAHSLGVPGKLLNVTMLAQRYAATLRDDLRRLRIAWRARGFHPVTDLATYRVYANGIGALLVRSGSRGERVHAAMQARGFDGHFHSLTSLNPTAKQFITTTVLLLTFAGLMVWDLLR